MSIEETDVELIKRGLWKAAMTKVRESIDAMPEPHKPQLKQIAEEHFPELVKEIGEVRDSFDKSKTIPEAGHFSGRYAVLYRELCKRVSLFLLGVNKKPQS